ncbi:hypothetical protein S101468_00928 [Acetobacter pasteurianus subsp. pasteurianus]|uniref:Uncharacterized protein n=1 Tax=Acetobacter pasteurianus subsp. pasteurianus TaxID=481145 RepID=A0AAC9SNX2_ACEPA|nr:hypothetical protein S101468_00928 [Acetobacter pasteurianus subsp. pasteurianus]
MPRYIVNTTMEDGTDSVTLTDFAHEAAFFAMQVKKPHEVRRIEDAQTGQEWTGSGIGQFIDMHLSPSSS